MKCLKLILPCSLFLLTAQGQQKETEKVKFIGTFQGGILSGGAKKTAAQFQLLAGIKKNAWLVSLGLGFDYYGYKRSVPLFIDIKNIIGRNKNAPFVYAAAGYNFSWLQSNEKTVIWLADLGKEKGGLYYDAGAGYKFSLNNKMAFGFSAGYSYKEQSETLKVYPFCEICLPPSPEPRLETYKYQLKRISIKLHCWF
jgi:hypothetical protein